MTRKLRPLFLIAFLTFPFGAAAFGISPPGVAIDRLVKGSRYEATVFLVRQDAKDDLGVKADFNIPEKIRSWVTTEPVSPFVIPAGTQQFPVKVVIKVPADADLGIYSGAITFNTVPASRIKGSGDQQVVITVGANLSLALTVGEGVFADFKIKDIDILDVKEGKSPRIAVTLQNTGNVPIAPDRATLDLFDKFGQTRLGFNQAEKFPETPAFETKRFTVEFPIDLKLGVGEYWAEAKIYRGEAVVGEMKTVFNVVEKKLSWWLIGLVVLVAVFGFFAFLFVRRHLKRSLLRLEPEVTVAPPVPEAKKTRKIKKK